MIFLRKRYGAPTNQGSRHTAWILISFHPEMALFSMNTAAIRT